MATDASYTVHLEEDPDTGDLILPFPPELLESLGWKEGDTLLWDVSDSGAITLTKEEKGSNITQ